MTKLAEAIFLLPRPRPREPIIIDARGEQRQNPAPAASPSTGLTVTPSAPVELPAYAKPPSDQAVMAAFMRGVRCQPDEFGRPAPWAHCNGGIPVRREPPVPPMAVPVKREAQFAAEKARANTPGRVPCVSMQSRTIGIGNMGLGKEHAVMVDPLCALAELAR
jgi:hypothetical protein